MPHLPPVEITGGSVTIKFAVSQKAEGKKEPLFKKRPEGLSERVTEHASDAEIDVSSIEYSARGVSIYRIDIEQEDGSVKKIYPKTKRCKVNVFYSTIADLKKAGIVIGDRRKIGVLNKTKYLMKNTQRY
jgi:hypothetical protein